MPAWWGLHREYVRPRNTRGERAKEGRKVFCRINGLILTSKRRSRRRRSIHFGERKALPLAVPRIAGRQTRSWPRGTDPSMRAAACRQLSRSSVVCHGVIVSYHRSITTLQPFSPIRDAQSRFRWFVLFVVHSSFHRFRCAKVHFV